MAIIDKGEIVALDTPINLKTELGGDVLKVEFSGDLEDYLALLDKHDSVNQIIVEDGIINIHVTNGESFVPKIFETAHGIGINILSVSMRKPNLEDVFLQHTGREMRDDGIADPIEQMRIYMRRKNK